MPYTLSTGEIVGGLGNSLVGDGYGDGYGSTSIYDPMKNTAGNWQTVTMPPPNTIGMQDWPTVRAAFNLPVADLKMDTMTFRMSMEIHVGDSIFEVKAERMMYGEYSLDELNRLKSGMEAFSMNGFIPTWKAFRENISNMFQWLSSEDFVFDHTVKDGIDVAIMTALMNEK